MDSYFSGLAQTSALGKDTLPSNAKPNYLNTEANMVKPVNEEIDRLKDDWDRHFEQMVEIYNHEFKKDENRPQEIINFLETGAKTYPKVKQFTDFLQDWNGFNNRLDRKLLTGIRGGDNWRQAAAFDTDVQALNENEAERMTTKADSITVGSFVVETATNAEDFDAGVQVLNGPNDAYASDFEEAKDLNQVLDNHPSFRAVAETRMQVWIPWLGEYYTYDRAPDAKTMEYIDNTIDAYYAFEHQGVTGGVLGKFKRDFAVPLIASAEARKKTWYENRKSALKDVALEQRSKELALALRHDPGALIKHIHTYRGVHDGNFAMMWKESVGDVITAIKSNELERSEVIGMLDYEYEARDGSGMTTMRKSRKNDTNKILKELRLHESEESNQVREGRQTEIREYSDAKIAELTSQDAPITYDQKKELILDVSQRFGITDESKLPENIKSLAYAGQEEDIEIDKRLKAKVYGRGESISMNDLKGLQDENLRKKWMQIVKGGSGLDQEGVSQRNNAIKAVVNNHTSEFDGSKDKTSRWWANYHQAIPAYNQAYNAAKIKDPAISDLDAHGIAMDAVNAQMKLPAIGPDGKPTGRFQWDELPNYAQPSYVQEAQNARNAILKDPNLLNSDQFWPGEQKYIQQAIKYKQRTSQGYSEALPEYYRMFPYIKMSPDKLLLHRLKSLGILKDGQIVLPEDENLSPEVATALTVKPNDSKTYKVTQENQDLDWMITTVQDPIAASNGGYDYVRAPDGSVAQLEKPLTQHTARELLGLMEAGYTDFGMFGIKAQGLKEILLANPIPLDAPFDEHNQNLMILARLRQKAQKAQEYSTLDGRYRRLIYIDDRLNEEFKRVVGELPPWMQLNNLLPACAEELCRTTLQQ